MRILCLLLLFCALFSCSEQESSSVLSTDALPSQLFTINTQKDTVLKTANGALIEIERESFLGGDGEVTLEVKEAYNIEDMLRAGLTTRSDEGTLRSDGMIFLEAEEDDVSIVKPVRIALPTDNYDVEMQLYKGEEKDGEVVWTEPKPIADSMPVYIQGGKALFDANCSTCHGLDKDLTGPALYGVEHRGPWVDRKELFAFTRNTAEYIPLSAYAWCLTRKYNGQVMPSFPQFSDEALGAIYDYIKYNEMKGGMSFYRDPCADSCNQYEAAAMAIHRKRIERENLVAGNERAPETNNMEITNDASEERFYDEEQVVAVDDRGSVAMEENSGEYYRFWINTFGWYNVDALLKVNEKLKESVLTVTLQGSQEKGVQIYLVIPSMKVFAGASEPNNTNVFVFHTEDGKLPLPQGEKAYIMAMSENAEGVMFAHKEFRTSLSQNISIEVKPSSKEEIHSLFKSLRLDDVAIEGEGSNEVAVKVEEAKKALEIMKLDEDIKRAESEIEKLRPKNCDCFCGDTAMRGISGDTTQLY